MGAETIVKKYSIEAYLEMEATSEVRHEYHRGELFAMAGGTYNHSVLGTNILVSLHRASLSQGCMAFNSDMKVHLETANSFVYPEASVVCGEVEMSKQTNHAITNPVLIVEVLSESTEAYDRGAKFRLYQEIPSFREYLLIDQHQPLVNSFYRRNPEVWEMRTYVGLEAMIQLQTLSVEISMQDLYRNTRDLKKPFPQG